MVLIDHIESYHIRDLRDIRQIFRLASDIEFQNFLLKEFSNLQELIQDVIREEEMTIKDIMEELVRDPTMYGIYDIQILQKLCERDETRVFFIHYEEEEGQILYIFDREALNGKIIDPNSIHLYLE